MSTYHAVVRWARGDDEFVRQRYSRGHSWHFDEGLTVPASASPHVVRAPFAIAAAVDPEEAVVAALASCHMLFFLALASKGGFVVERYEDAADGLMEKNADGKVAITKVTIRPQVTFSGTPPTAEEFAGLHHQAHEECYIANSVRSEVVCEPKLIHLA
ncbi:MAG: OsmC family protein [Gemmatimonadaceae bacterium]